MGNKNTQQINKDIYNTIIQNRCMKTLEHKLNTYKKYSQFDINNIYCYDGQKNCTLIDAICMRDNITCDTIKLLHINGAIIKDSTFHLVLKKLVEYYKTANNNIGIYEAIIRYIYSNINNKSDLYKILTRITSDFAIAHEKFTSDLFKNFMTMFDGKHQIPLDDLYLLRYNLWRYILIKYKNLIPQIKTIVHYNDNFFGNVAQRLTDVSMNTTLMHTLCSEAYYNSSTIELIPLFVSNGLLLDYSQDLTDIMTYDMVLFDILYTNNTLWYDIQSFKYENNIVDKFIDCIIQQDTNINFHSIILKVISTNGLQYLLDRIVIFKKQLTLQFVINHIINNYHDYTFILSAVEKLIDEKYVDSFELVLEILCTILDENDSKLRNNVIKYIIGKQYFNNNEEYILVKKSLAINTYSVVLDIFGNKLDIFERLGKEGYLFDLTSMGNLNDSNFNLLISYMDVNTVNKKGMSLLSLICNKLVNYYTIEILLYNGINVNIVDRFGNSALLYFVMRIDNFLKFNAYKCIDAFNLFLTHGANINIVNIKRKIYWICYVKILMFIQQKKIKW